MDDLERLQKLTEGLLDGKLSKLEHAKRMGVENSKNSERVFEILLELELDTLGHGIAEMVNDAIEDCIETRRILSKIK